MLRRTLLVSSLVLMLAFVLLALPLQNIRAANDTICYALIPFPSDVRVDHLSRGPDGNLWFSEVFTTAPGTERIGTLTANGIFHFPVPDAVREMTSGPDGNIWYSTWSTGTVVRITPQGDRTAFPIVGNNPVSVATGSDGNLWVAEWSTNQIERVSTEGTVTGQFAIPTSNAWPENLVLGPDTNLWFIEANANKIGRIDMSGSITEFNPLPSPDTLQIVTITSGADGNLWFSEYARLSTEPCDFYSSFDKITVEEIITRFPKLSGVIINQLTAAADGNVWGRLGGCHGDGNSVIRITPDGSPTIFWPDPALFWGTEIAGIDGAIWLNSNTDQQFATGWLNGLGYFDPRNILTTCTRTYFPLMGR